MADLSIIIVNWNTRALLADCLESVFANADGVRLEVFVVDNGSTDGSQAMIAQGFPQVRLIENADNRGFAAANNQAIRICQGKYVLLLNSDTLVLPGALAALVHFADQRPEAGVIGCRLINRDGSLQESWASFPSLWSEFLGRNFRRRKLIEQAPPAYDVDWVGGACLLARAAAIRGVGLLDESFFMYSEETDWCFRMRRHGWRVYYLHGAAVVHLGGGSASRASALQLIRLYTGKLRFFRKHYGVWQTALLRFGLVIVNSLGWVIRALTMMAQPGRDDNRRHQLQARRDLIQWLAGPQSLRHDGEVQT